MVVLSEGQEPLEKELLVDVRVSMPHPNRITNVHEDHFQHNRLQYQQSQSFHQCLHIINKHNPRARYQKLLWGIQQQKKFRNSKVRFVLLKHKANNHLF